MPELQLCIFGYDAGHGEDRLQKIAAGAFNMIQTNDFHHLSNSERHKVLDTIGKYGLKLVPWYCGFGGQSDYHYDQSKSYRENINFLRAKAISDFDGHPNLFAWFLWDEPEPDWDDPPTWPVQEEVYNEAKNFGATKPLGTNYDQGDWERGNFAAHTFDLFWMDAYHHWAGRTNEDALRQLDTAVGQRAHFFRKAAELGKPFAPIIQAYRHGGAGSEVVYGSLKQQLQVYQKYMPCSGVWYYKYPIVIDDPVLYEEAKALNLELGGTIWQPPLPEHEDITCDHCKSVLRIHYK